MRWLNFEEKEEESPAADESATGASAAAAGGLPVQKAKSKLANMVAPKAEGDATGAVAATSSASSSSGWGWTGRVRCNPSKSGADKFRTVTRWKPVHKKINDEEKLHTYVRAIREHAHTHTHAQATAKR
jgi:hypothetical protein